MTSSAQPPALIRPMTFDDIPDVVELQKRAFPGMASWTAEQLAEHLRLFPEGQLVAVDEAGIVGSASSLIIDWDDYADAADWATITGNGTFSTHNPLGKTLHGADMGLTLGQGQRRCAPHRRCRCTRTDV